MSSQVLRYANTGVATISTANDNLNGTGTLGTILAANNSSEGFVGTMIDSITIKATQSTTEGMVRLFIYNGAVSRLYREIYIPAIIQTSVVGAFRASFQERLYLKPGEELRAATQNGESFNIVANGSDRINCECITGGCNKSFQFNAHTGAVAISTANPNLNGSGTLGTVLTAPSGSLVAGAQIYSVIVKAAQSTSQGMVRLFVYNGTSNFLIREIPIPATTQTGFEPAYRAVITLNMFLAPSYALKASTENAEIFNIVTFATDATNCDCPA